MTIKSDSGIVTSTPRVVRLVNFPVNVMVNPAAGTTAKVEVTSSEARKAFYGEAIWEDWPLGTVSEMTRDVTTGPFTALRITRVSGSGNVVWEVNQ